MRDISYKSRNIRLDDDVYGLFKGLRESSGKSWNLFIRDIVYDLDIKEKDKPKDELNAILNLFYKETHNNNLFVNKTQRKALKDIIGEVGRQEVIDMIKFAFLNKDEDFCPQISSPRELQYKWSKLEKFKRDKKVEAKEEIREAWSVEKQMRGDL